MIRINQDLLQYITQLWEKELAANITVEKFKTGEQIIPQGRRIFSVYVLKTGIAKCYLTEENGKDFIQEFFGEGELFGEIEALNNTGSFCCIEAVTEVEVYTIGHKHFLQFLENDAAFNKLILQALAAKISYKAHRHAYHQSHTAEENLLKLIRSFPALTKTIAKPDIANYLGITLRSLNRTFNSLKMRNLID